MKKLDLPTDGTYANGSIEDPTYPCTMPNAQNLNGSIGHVETISSDGICVCGEKIS